MLNPLRRQGGGQAGGFRDDCQYGYVRQLPQHLHCFMPQRGRDRTIKVNEVIPRKTDKVWQLLNGFQVLLRDSNVGRLQPSACSESGEQDSGVTPLPQEGQGAGNADFVLGS